MKKSYNIVMYSIIAVLVIVIAVTLAVRFDLLPKNKQGNMWQKNKSGFVKNNENHFDKKLYHVGDEVKTNGDFLSFTYKITKVNASKKRSIINFPMDKVWDEVTVDGGGNITNNYSYVLVQATITNPKDEKQELYLNSNHLNFRDKNGTEIYGAEPFAMNQNVENARKKNAMKYIFKPNESNVFELVYIVEDKYMDDLYTMVYTITNESATVYNPKTKMYECSEDRFIQIRKEDIEKNEEVTQN